MSYPMLTGQKHTDCEVSPDPSDAVLRENVSRLVPQWMMGSRHVVQFVRDSLDHLKTLPSVPDVLVAEWGYNPLTQKNGLLNLSSPRGGLDDCARHGMLLKFVSQDPYAAGHSATLIPLDFFCVLPRDDSPYCLYDHTSLDLRVAGAGTGQGTEVAPSYVGLSSRPWFTRWREHGSDALSGVNRKFCRHIRSWQARRALLGHDFLVMHHVFGYGLKKDRAYELEEYNVAYHWGHPECLNMIPGGYAGIELLASLGYPRAENKKQLEAIARQVLDDYDSNRLSWWAKAMLDGDRQKIEDYYAKHPGWLAPEQVRYIRRSADGGKAPEDIAAALDSGAKHKLQQVERVLSGRTYSEIS